MNNIKERVSCVALMLLLFWGCSNCPSEIKISSDLSLGSSGLSIVSILNLDELIYIDGARNEYVFTVVEYSDSFEKVVQTTGRFECENGNKADGYYLSERKFKRYESTDGNSISMTLHSWNPQLVLNENEIITNEDTGRDIFLVELVFNGCDTVRESRFLDLNNENSNIFSNNIPHIKHGQTHDSIFSVGVLSYPVGMIFSYNKGLVSLNYCDLNLVQKE